MNERMLHWMDLGQPEEDMDSLDIEEAMRPLDTHEIKESEIPKHTMTFDKQATGAAADQKHYQKAEKEPIEVMQMYFTAQELYGFCKGNVEIYPSFSLQRDRTQGHGKGSAVYEVVCGRPSRCAH